MITIVFINFAFLINTFDQIMTKKRILLIEDNDDILEIVRFVLEDEGYLVTAATPRPAAELATQQADLIVLDEWINKTEGHMLCREIKNIQEMKHIPVIIFSTATDIEEIMETCEADGYVTKPFDIDDLLNEVSRCLSGRNQTSVTLI